MTEYFMTEYGHRLRIAISLLFSEIQKLYLNSNPNQTSNSKLKKILTLVHTSKPYFSMIMQH